MALVNSETGEIVNWSGEIHPVADLFPMVDGEALAEMAESIKASGLIHPVVLTVDGMLLDGRNRMKACELAGVKTVRAIVYSGSSPTEFVIAENLKRRHLNGSQLDFLALDLLPHLEAEAAKRTGGRPRSDEKPPANLQEVSQPDVAPRFKESTHRAAKAVGRSGRSVAKAKKVADRAPDLADRVRSGEIATDRAERMLRDRDAEAKRVQTAKENPRPADLTVDLRHGDFRSVFDDVAEVDAIITDPPYPAEFLPLLEDLAKFADGVLTDDGILAILMGQTHLPEVYRLLDGHRPYRWTMCYLTPGAAYASHARRLQSNWKPVLIYGGGPRFADVLRSDSDSGKEHHFWGQDYGGFSDLVGRLTLPGQTVMDPFMGSGTTLLAAHHLGRHVIGCDIDANHVATATDRFGEVAA